MAPVSAAERQRQCRARRNADLESKKKHLQKERERWRKKKDSRKSINELNERDKRKRRKLWREHQRTSRLKKKAMKDMPDRIPQVPSTMRIHQVVTTSPGPMLYRDVSCMCTVDKILQCTCYDTKAFSFNTPSTPKTEEIEWGPEVIQKWCVIKYDGGLYPGIITAIDEVQVQVRCMHHVGMNRFCWPNREDMIWYTFNDVICFIPPPQPVTTRHREIQRDIWAKLVENKD
ncbi:hypothetical protein DPEC_G00281510 [Dallia pectoralis]|uniref:Uncharacterized protein n=1 Tax=Dallia pectoralis TaxID=75939 RepID=A0ACC2FN01_DALPE|nr:hypothetical protein DPEC_G00281510 [Dallia pectoralis]